jgi:hypothetical protein
MRAAAKASPIQDGQLKHAFKDGADTFFNKGTNGRWKDVLSADESTRCDELAAENLTPRLRALAEDRRTAEVGRINCGA